MSSTLRLTYFDYTGRAEAIRLLLAYGQLEYEVVRYSFEEYFTKLKPTLDLPYGQMPTIQVNGKTYGQSIAIARYVAKQVGLYPQDDLKALEADSLVDAMLELYAATYPIVFHEKDEAAKQSRLANLNELVIPASLNRLNVLAQGPYFGGNAMTFADIVLLDMAENLLGGFPGRIVVTLDKYPQLQSIVERVRADERLKSYYAAKKSSSKH